jgi:hypothetical protein
MTMKKTFKIADVLLSLRPGAQWTSYGNSYDDLVWHELPVEEGGQEMPTEEEIQTEIERLQQEWNNTEYQRLRAKEYPDFKEYLDGIVKSDEAQVQAYIDACLAVKAKYPKPEIIEE